MSLPSRPLSLVSGSQAEDLGYRTIADIHQVAEETGSDYRLVGGLAVSLLHALHGSPGEVPSRQTADADLGADDTVLADGRLVAALTGRGYVREGGNRFRLGGGDEAKVIDLLVPVIGHSLVPNIECGDLSVDGVPGLRLALTRPPVLCHLTAVLTDGSDVVTKVSLPDVLSALTLKAYAFNGRSSDRDVLDLWKLLEVAHQTGLDPSEWEPLFGQRKDAATTLHRRLAAPNGPGAHVARRQSWPHARIRALVLAHVPSIKNP